MTLTLYHHNSSVCAAKIRVAFAEKGLAWESVLMRLDGDQFAPAYLTLNPAAVVPTLVHDGAAIIESNIILDYLDDAFPEKPLRPADSVARADAQVLIRQLDDGTDGLHHAISVLTYAIAYRNRLVDNAGGADPAVLGPIIETEMNAKSRIWLEDVVYRGIMAPTVRDCLGRFDRLIAGFEARLSRQPWLVGDAYCTAETAFTPYMIRLELLRLNFLWRDRPAVAEWFARLKARKSTAEVLDWCAASNLELLDTYGRALSGPMEELLNDPND